jgi:CRP/FNR family transcriptional regulator, cyclic AMP receptor protein
MRLLEFYHILFQEMAMNILDYVHNVSTHHLKKGEIVFSQGDRSDGNMYFIFAGELSILKIRDGKQHEIGTLTAGEFFGEMALISSESRAATIKVKSDESKLGALDKDNFIKLSKVSPQFLFLLLKKAIERLTLAERKIEMLDDSLKNLK